MQVGCLVFVYDESCCCGHVFSAMKVGVPGVKVLGKDGWWLKQKNLFLSAYSVSLSKSRVVVAVGCWGMDHERG